MRWWRRASWSRPRVGRRWSSGAVLVVVAAFGVSGCREQVAVELDERQGLELMEVLEGAALSARWRRGASAAGGAVTVRRSEAAEARRLLLAHRLPRREADWLARLDEARGVVPSPELEAWRRVMVQALAVEASLASLAGVRRAQVHVALDEQAGGRRGGRAVATASVLLYGDPACRTEACPRPDLEQVRRWVSGGFDGLSAAEVEVGWVEPLPVAVAERPLRAWGPWVVHERSLPSLRAAALAQAALWLVAALALARRQRTSSVAASDGGASGVGAAGIGASGVGAAGAVPSGGAASGGAASGDAASGVGQAGGLGAHHRAREGRDGR